MQAGLEALGKDTVMSHSEGEGGGCQGVQDITSLCSCPHSCPPTPRGSIASEAGAPHQPWGHTEHPTPLGQGWGPWPPHHSLLC